MIQVARRAPPYVFFKRRKPKFFFPDGECRGGRRKGEGDCRPPPFAPLDAFV